jgi:hypothetical protein
VLEIAAEILQAYVPHQKFMGTSQHQAVDLVKQGYIPTRPLSSTLAITTTSLHIYLASRSHCPSYSIEVFAKALCFNNKV